LFIVVGGNTLARGLTLEGLVCSYFVRDSKQADTLLQMGRWFGYRIGYELLPRIWMTRRTMKCFWALGLLDEAMRDELRRWQKSPDHSQGPRVPVLSEYVPRMILTGRNRQQAARVFTPLGRKHQHLLLDYNIEPNVLASNKQLAVNFIQSLGAWEDSTQNRSLYHTDIDWAHIRSFIENFNVCEDSKNFNGQDLQKVINYGEENINQPWTVILPGKERPAEDEFSFTDSIGHDHHLIKKSRTISGLDEAGCIMRFQTIAMPEEFIVDIDAERDLGDATKTWGSENKKGLGPDEYRKAAGKSGIPLLVIKNLIPKDGGRQIHLADDLITFYLYLPEPDRNDNDNRWRAFLAANIEEPNDGNGQIDEADVLEDNQQA
ncbi:MAG: hypothetical protein IJS08_04470, partial [Victivallales bacterium]|nr:hypothetical protein [Victivallales bacterium]